MELKDLPENLRIQAEKKLREQGLNPKKQNKYHNLKTEVVAGGREIRFDSRKEANRYNELMMMQKSSQIENLRLQVHFPLMGAFTTSDGVKVRGIEYVADFTYVQDGKLVIEDVKSEITKKDPVYVMKKKLMAEKGYMIKEV